MNSPVRLPIPRLKIWQWLVLVVAFAAAAVAIFYGLRATGALDALRAIPVRATIERIADLGPLPFLVALAVLPALGIPISLFYVLAGKVFEAHGGLGAAVAGCFVAVAVNIALSYAVARWLMHPLIERLVGRLGWKVPQVRHRDRWIVTLLVRITPGPPFFVQHYLLALGGVPFGAYMLVSVPVAWMLGFGVIFFGDSLARGSWGKVAVGVAVVVAVILVVRLARNRLARRAPADELPVAPVDAVGSPEDEATSQG